jgi:phage antirepressor YoqD-like protein
MENKVFNYNGANITFQLGNGNVMVNLTEVAKAFPDKNLSDIINSKEIKEYVQGLTEIGISISADLLIVRKGGDPNKQGTWAHQKVALRVCQKLSTQFAIWVDTKIEELLATGVALASDDDAMIARAMEVLQRRLEYKQQQLQEAERQNYELEEKTELQEQIIKSNAPKIEYFEKVLESKGYLTVNMIAAELGMSHIKLNKLLCQWGVQYKQTDTYFLTSQYRDKGYTVHRPHAYTDSQGNIRTVQHMYWTEKGKKFIVELYYKKKQRYEQRKNIW